MMWAAAATSTITIVIRKASNDFTPIAQRTIQITSPVIVVSSNPIEAATLAKRSGEVGHQLPHRGGGV